MTSKDRSGRGRILNRAQKERAAKGTSPSILSLKGRGEETARQIVKWLLA
jgi:hypothetical protein